MVEIEFVEVDQAELFETKAVVAQQKSDDEQVEDTKLYIQNLFASSGGADDE